MVDLSLLGGALTGRLSFKPRAPTLPALPPGRHSLGLSEERDAVLIVPEGLAPGAPVPLLVMFHGAGGSADKVLPFLLQHARQRQFLLLLPQSQFPTWDLVIAGNGPDLERLDQALAAVASRFPIDAAHLGFAGFSDGGSYALSIGVTNGDVASHVMVFSGGFMSVFQQHGAPRVFISHGRQDEQIAVGKACGHADKLRAAGYAVEFLEFEGPHAIQPPVVERALAFFLGNPPG